MRRTKKKDTFFDKSWLSDPEFSLWLLKGNSETTFRCRVCPEKEKTKFKTLGDMGVGALKKHAGTDAHVKNITQYKSTLSFFPKQQQQQPKQQQQQQLESNNSNNNQNITPDPIPSIFSIYAVAKADIIWALYCVQHGLSDNSMKEFGETLRTMCPSSPEAQNFKMASTKLMYVVNHGLYPYFKELLQTEVAAAPYITPMFDESMNDVLQKSEMDVHIRYWDDTENKVKVRYFDSRFLGHTKHDDILSNFNDVLKPVDTTKILQVSVDGPNTNIKFLDCLKKERVDNELSGLIDIGSCNLHTVHGCFADGVKASGWNLKKLLKGCYHLFHDTAARREDYFTLTGYDKFPFQFIVTRWVEDKKVASRLILIWPNILKIYDFWEGLAKSKRPSSKSYKNVLAHIDDKLIIAKLHFFCYLAGILEPYLTCHQGEGPMIPFMDGDIKHFFKGVLAVVVKSKVLEKCQSGLDLVRLDVDDENNLIPTCNMHLGFAAQDEISKVGDKVGAEDVKNLKEGEKKFGGDDREVTGKKSDIVNDSEEFRLLQPQVDIIIE